MRKEKKSFNWAKYERDNEIRKLAELLKSIIWRLDDSYRMERRGRERPYYPPKGMALLAAMMFMSSSEREYVNWLKTNKWLIELAESPNTPDRKACF